MDPDQIKRMKTEYVRRHPSITFEAYLKGGTFSIAYAAMNGRVPCVVKFSREPISVNPAIDKERSAILDLLLPFNGHPHIASLQVIEEIEGHLVTQWEKGEMDLETRLKQCIDQKKPGLPRAELLGYMHQAADGLTLLNSKFVHRDIKPANLLLFCGQVKVIDFGFARLAEARPHETSTIVGTESYAPPETRDRKEVNKTVDIYCLAATFIHLATGKLPFGGGDDMMQRKREGHFERDGLLPHEIAALTTALHPDPNKRTFASALDFVKALQSPVAHPPIPDSPGSDSPGPNSSAPDSPPPEVTTASTGKSTADSIAVVAAVSADASWRDQIHAFLTADDARRTQSKRNDKDWQKRLEQEFRQLLGQQLKQNQLAWAHGTAEALLRWEPQDKDLVEIRSRLQQIDPETGRPQCCDVLGQRFVLIPPGEFWMGSAHNVGNSNERPRHLVRITQPFYMSIYPVTVEQFQRFVTLAKWKNDAWMAAGIKQGPDHPVVNVNRDDILAYCEYCTSCSSVVDYGLPTEAMWEYACRGGTDTPHYAGNDAPSLRTISHLNAGSTAPVGKLKPNSFGLYDMLGNVWEQCHDFFDEAYYCNSTTEDPQGPKSGSTICRRGGSWNDGFASSRSGCRGFQAPSRRVNHCGFRVACRLRQPLERP